MKALGGGLADIDGLKQTADDVFDEKDTAGNGTIKPEDAKELSETLLTTVGVNAQINEDLYNGVFDNLERNADNVVSKGEFFDLTYNLWKEIFNQVSDLIVHPEEYDGVQTRN